RVNPLFEEDGYTKGKRRWHNYLKNSSSGYESRYSSDHANAAFEGENNFQREAVTILEQNTSFVKSILVAVRGKKQSITLNPIPEDNININHIDYTIPRPVWPRHEKYKKQQSYKSEDKIHDWHSEDEKSRENNFIVRRKMGYEEKAESTKDILKDLAKTINLAIDQKNQVSPEDLLKTLSETINKNWDMLSSDSAVRQLSRNLNQTEVATISRAFSHTSSFSEPFLSNRPLSDAEAGRLSLLQRLGKLSLYEPPVYEKHTRESSSSSEETSSGFSEFSPSPATSSSDDSPSSRRSPENSKVPLFTHDNLSTVSNGLRNAVLYGSSLQCREGQNEYEKLNFRDRKSSEEEKIEDSLQDLTVSNWKEVNSNTTKEYDAQHQSSSLVSVSHF
ncbi:hypothetical protein WDU94_014652, partial [Cyamophila willieti]